MNVDAVAFDRLTDEEIAAWSAMQRGNPLLDSPFFRPEFARAVAAVRGDVEVAVLKAAGQLLGFLPFHRLPWNTGTPLASVVSDFHAVIAPRNVAVDPVDVIRGAGLASWKFDHLLCAQMPFGTYVRDEFDSPYIDLRAGFDAYISDRDNGKRILKQYRRKRKNLERELGPVRFEAHVADPSVMATCVQWKSEQYRRTRVPNVLSSGWVLDLLETILATGSENFAPMVAVMYAGDQIAAIDVGMRSRAVWHPWFCAYNMEMENHSPGIIHLIEMMKTASEIGIRRIDLSAGGESYKGRFTSGVTRVGKGTVDARSSVANVRRAWWRVRGVIRSSPLAFPARRPARMLYRLRNRLELQRPGRRRETRPQPTATRRSS